MNSLFQSYVIASIQDEFQTAWAAGTEAAVPVYYDGQEYNPADHAESVRFSVSGPRGGASHNGHYTADVTVDAIISVKLSSDVLRVREIAGAAEAILRRWMIQVKTHPSANPAQYKNGSLKFRDADVLPAPLDHPHSTGGASEVPLQQIAVSVDGRIDADE
jgi:hypothetical protein